MTMDHKTRQKIAARLQRIEEAHSGRLTPEAVVADAGDPESPLHELFEWDDSIAAHQHRLYQARSVIRSVRMDVRVEQRSVSTVRYVRDPSAGEEQGYVSIASLRTEVDLARETVQTELKRAQSMLQRARNIADVLGLGEELDALMAQVEHVYERTDRNWQGESREAAV